MKDYKQIVREAQKELTELMNLAIECADNDEHRLNCCIEMQQLMLDLGSLMQDELNLHKTKIIEVLEVGCELCYQYVEKLIDAGRFETFMKYILFNLLDTFAWSVPKGAHELSVSAIIKNERNIIEWIEYHLLVGVSHFYIYDNESTDGLKEKLQKYIDLGIVTYIWFPGKYQQHPASNYSVEHFKYETKWLAIIDGDEYIVPVEEGKLIPQVLEEIVENYNNHPMRLTQFVGGIGINWRDYGTSGHKTRCEGLCIENYKYRAENDYFQNAHIKSIFNPRVVTYIDNPHYAHFEQEFYCISEKGSYIPYSYFYDSACEKLRINHYFSKSEEELISKNKRGWPDRDLYREDNKELYEASVNCNKIYDPIMERFIDKVKERMQETLG